MKFLFIWIFYIVLLGIKGYNVSKSVYDFFFFERKKNVIFNDSFLGLGFEL